MQRGEGWCSRPRVHTALLMSILFMSALSFFLYPIYIPRLIASWDFQRYVRLLNFFLIYFFAWQLSEARPPHGPRPSTLSNLFQKDFLMQKLLISHPDFTPRFFFWKQTGAVVKQRQYACHRLRRRIGVFCWVAGRWRWGQCASVQVAQIAGRSTTAS